MAITPHRPQPDTPLADIIAYYNQNFDVIDDEDRTKIIRNAGIPQILFGYQRQGFGTLDYGLKVSKINPATNAPYDVTIATDDQLYFTSASDTLRIVQTGTLEVTTSGDTTITASVAHGLSGPKMLMGFVQADWNPGVFLPVPYIQNDAAFATGASIDWMAKMHVTATDVVATVSAVVATGAPVGTYDGTSHFRYYLLQETAA